MPAGSSRDERLDPFTLPVRFAVADKAADGRVRHVELTRERVVVRRAVRGIKMAVNLPVTAYLGVALRMEPPEGDTPGAVSVVLEHRDHALSLPLFAPTTAPTSWPNGSRGRACSACRSWSPKRTDACAKRSTASAPFASPPPPGGVEGARRSGSGGRPFSCGARSAVRSRMPPCIATSARSSHGIERSTNAILVARSVLWPDRDRSREVSADGRQQQFIGTVDDLVERRRPRKQRSGLGRAFLAARDVRQMQLRQHLGGPVTGTVKRLPQGQMLHAWNG